MRISVAFHHDGIFTPSPFMYKEGDASTIRDIEFEGMTLIGLLKKLKGACQIPVKGIYFLIPGKELSNGLMEIKDDSNLAEYVGEMEDISGYGVSDFVREDDVVIPNRTINDSFLNKLCNGTFISDHTDTREPTDKELLINSDVEGVNIRYKVVDGVLYPEFDLSLPWNEMKPTLDSRFGGKKCKKWDLPAKKGKVEGVQIESPSKKAKGVHTESPSNGKKAGTLKLAGLKRRRKSERIENRAKAFKFSKDAAGSSADKAWDVDEALAEP
ncbi:hypothetical protein Tco_1363029 [Tanacetum coccineum]